MLALCVKILEWRKLKYGEIRFSMPYVFAAVTVSGMRNYTGSAGRDQTA
jgi:hypothetical protein